MTRTPDRLLTGFDIADGHAMPRLTACLKTLTCMFPVSRRQLFAVTPNFFRILRGTIDWYHGSIINFTAALELTLCGLLRSIEFCPKNAKWASPPYRLARSDVTFYPNLANTEYCLVRIVLAKKHSSPEQYNNRNSHVLPRDDGAHVNVCRVLRTLLIKDPIPAADAATTPLFRDLSKTNKKRRSSTRTPSPARAPSSS